MSFTKTITNNNFVANNNVIECILFSVQNCKFLIVFFFNHIADVPMYFLIYIIQIHIYIYIYIYTYRYVHNLGIIYMDYYLFTISLKFFINKIIF
jgi:hypothetical protein